VIAVPLFHLSQVVVLFFFQHGHGTAVILVIITTADLVNVYLTASVISMYFCPSL